jgi:hypothetical protein
MTEDMRLAVRRLHRAAADLIVSQLWVGSPDRREKELVDAAADLLAQSRIDGIDLTYRDLHEPGHG